MCKSVQHKTRLCAVLTEYKRTLNCVKCNPPSVCVIPTPVGFHASCWLCSIFCHRKLKNELGKCVFQVKVQKSRNQSKFRKSKNWFVYSQNARFIFSLSQSHIRPLPGKFADTGTTLISGAREWEKEKHSHSTQICGLILPALLFSTAARTCEENNRRLKQTSPNHYVQKTIAPSLSIFLCVCPFLSVPSPSSSSHPPLHHAGSLVFLKISIWALERDKAEGGQEREG